MATDPPSPPKRRADAERNRVKILAAARAAFAQAGADVSMAEVSRRADVGMATLYRNFPGRRELLEALYVEEVDAICEAAHTIRAPTAGATLEAWLRRFVEFFASKHDIANELLKQTDRHDPVFDNSRARVTTAGQALLDAAQASGEIRRDLTLEQLLDMVIALSAIRGDAAYLEPILRAALDGIRAPGQPTSATSAG